MELIFVRTQYIYPSMTYLCKRPLGLGFVQATFCKNIIFEILAIIFRAFWTFQSFPGFFSTCFEISVWNLVYTCSSRCSTSSSSFIPIGTICPTLQPKKVQSHLSALMALKIIQGPQIWYTHLKVYWSPLIFITVGQFLALWLTKTLERGCY